MYTNHTFLLNIEKCLYIYKVLYYIVFIVAYILFFFVGSETRTKCDAGVGKFERLSGNFSI